MKLRHFRLRGAFGAAILGSFDSFFGRWAFFFLVNLMHFLFRGAVGLSTEVYFNRSSGRSRSPDSTP